jgi:hypothetical protein
MSTDLPVPRTSVRLGATREPSEGSAADPSPNPLATTATPRWLVALQLLGACAWVGLVTWRLDRVPGMSMDEGWSMLSARGQWPPANPLSGMSAYTGPFPVLALRAFGPNAGLLVLRITSIAAHAGLLLTLALILRRYFRARSLALWALPLIATGPAWLVSMRIGIEVLMFTAPLTVLGFYCASRPGRGWAFVGGACWGLAVYNHLLALWAVAAVGGAWLYVYRRWREVPWGPLLVGFALGLSPRVVAMLLYDNEQITSTTSSLSLLKAIGDLRWIPIAFWQTLDGRIVYFRYVGRLAREMVPYWAVGLAFFVPWWRQWRELPRAALFTLLAVVAYCVLTTLGAPYLESRYLLLPAIGLPVAFVILGATAIERDARWGYLVRGAAGLIIAGNLYYTFANFYLPWQRHELGMMGFRVGDRSPTIGSWHFLPKEALVEHLRRLDPPPQQIVTGAPLQRTLRAIMGDTPSRVLLPTDADRNLPSVFVEYRSPRSGPRTCLPAQNGKMCFVNPTVVDNFYWVYRSAP